MEGILRERRMSGSRDLFEDERIGTAFLLLK